MQFIASGSQLFPLYTCVQYIENVVKDFVKWQLSFWTFKSFFKVWFDVSIEVFYRDLFGEGIVDKLFLCGIIVHRDVVKLGT